jgi:cytoskeleton protein RodZ
MNDPVAVESLAVRADAPAEAAPAGFGYALAQARVRAGLSIEQAAARLRLSARQLRALENEELQSLPAPAYVNGFVRNYARELGIDSGPLVEDLNAKLKLKGLSGHAPDLGPGGAVPGRGLDDRAWRHLVLVAIALTLLSALLIGVWMARSERRAQPSAASAALQGAAATAPAAAPAPVPAPSPAPPSGNAPAQGAAASTPPPAASPAPAPIPAPPAATLAPSSPAAAQAAAPSGEGKAPAAVDPRVPVAAVTAAAGAGNGLVLRFADRSWVEVSQPGGRVLLSRTDEAGSMELVNAPAPLMLVIGRSDVVSVEYRGQEVNLKPYANSAGVARVLLAEGRAGGGGPINR